MGIVNGIRTIDSILAGALSGAQLETWLGTGINKAGFTQAINVKTQLRLLIESSSAMAVVAASTIAMTAIVENSYALDLLIANSGALAAVAASTTAKMVLFSSDLALTEIAASATAIAVMRAAAQYAVYASNSAWGTTTRTLAGLNAAGSYIVLGASTNDSSTGETMTIATRKSGSTRGNTNTTAADNVSLTTALGEIVMPMVTPFTIVSTDSSTQIGYVGALRCDV